MSTIKGIVATSIMYTLIGTGVVIGYNAGQTIWENGLGDKVVKVTRKLLTKKGES